MPSMLKWIHVLFSFLNCIVIDDLPQAANQPAPPIVTSHLASTNEPHQHEQQGPGFLGIQDAAFVKHIVDAFPNVSSDHLLVIYHLHTYLLPTS